MKTNVDKCIFTFTPPFLLTAFCVLFWVSTADATVPFLVVDEVLAFENVAPSGSGSPFTIDGYFVEGNYRVFTPYGQWVDSSTEDVGTEHPDNGTDWFLNNSTISIEITHSLGLPIFLNSFDATEFAWNQPGGSPIAVEGIRADGSTLAALFSTQDREMFHTPLFETFLLSSEWFTEPFSIVKIGAPSRGFAIDNIRLSAVVPEPTTVFHSCVAVLLALGVIRYRTTIRARLLSPEPFDSGRRWLGRSR